MLRIEWDSQEGYAKGGDITVSLTGVSVGTECHGCDSDELQDFTKIKQLRDALNELLEPWAVRQ